MHEGEAFAQRHAEVIHELKRRRAGAALLAVDDDEIRGDPGLEHRLDHGQELPGVADAEFEAGRLAAGERAKARDELHHLDGRGESRMPCRGDAVLADLHPADLGDLLGYLRRWQDAAMPGFGSL